MVNHGVSALLLEYLRREIIGFFNLPLEEKDELWQQPDNHEGFGQLFVVSEEQKLDWSDMFYITTLPTSLRKMELFEKIPQRLRSLSLSLTHTHHTHTLILILMQVVVLYISSEATIRANPNGETTCWHEYMNLAKNNSII